MAILSFVSRGGYRGALVDHRGSLFTLHWSADRFVVTFVVTFVVIVIMTPLSVDGKFFFLISVSANAFDDCD